MIAVIDNEKPVYFIALDIKTAFFYKIKVAVNRSIRCVEKTSELRNGFRWRLLQIGYKLQDAKYFTLVKQFTFVRLQIRGIRMTSPNF